MKKLSMYMALLLLGVSTFFLPPRAEAAKITFDNHREQKIVVSLIYYDVNENSWCCQGWWSVNALENRTIKVPHDPHKRIYYYIESGGKAVHKRSEGWARWNVINNAFKYYEHDGCPEGKKPRAVYFNCSRNVTGDSWKLKVK